GGSFHVGGPNPDAARPPALPAARPRPSAIPPEARRDPTPSGGGPASAPLPAPRPRPAGLPGDCRAAPRPGAGPAPWLRGARGSAAILTLVAMIILARSVIIARPVRPSKEADAGRPAMSPPAPADRPPLTTAQIVARCEPSVALVKGKASSGTGF